MENPNTRSRNKHHHRKSLSSSNTTTANATSSKRSSISGSSKNTTSGASVPTRATSVTAAGAQSRSRESARAHNFSRPSPSHPSPSGPTHPSADLQYSSNFTATNNPGDPYSSYSERFNRPVSPRPTSPGGLSRVSTSSSIAGNGPQLRKKTKSIAISNHPRPGSSGLLTSPSSSSLDIGKDEQYTPATTHNPANSSKPLSRTDSDNSQRYSPVLKRPPASHSSYGVETISGPPPSYTTQRKISQEGIRKPERNTIIWSPQSQGNSKSSPHDSETRVEPGSAREPKPDSTAQSNDSSPATADTQSVTTPGDLDSMANITIRGQHGLSRQTTDEESIRSSSDERKSEDLFLNIAKVDASRPATSKTEKRRSRISLPFLSASRPTQERRSSPVRSHVETEQPTPLEGEVPRYYSKRSSLGQHMPGAFSRTYHQDGYRFRERSVEPGSDAEKSERQYGRRDSNSNADTVKLAHRSSQGLKTQRLASDAGYDTQSKAGETIATESTASTAAPSTVWDELDDLKSRIRKLELTGKLPPSSAAAMSSAERPRTATTTATSMSMSPKYQGGGTALPSSMEGIPSDVHPLLHEALAHARQVLSHDVFQSLYATASDALQLASMMNSNEARSYADQTVTSMTERQIRKRTESMCRGLTELAIALSAESKQAPANHRPISRESSHPPNAMLRSRRYSNDPGERPASSRVASRLETRRSSVHMGQSAANALASAPESGFRDSPTTLPQLPGIRLNRTVASTRSRRAPGPYDGGDDESEASPSVRPLSRAMTEFGAYRRTPKDHAATSRDTAGQYAHPGSDDNDAGVSLTPSVPFSNNSSAAFVTRRKYASPGSVASGVQDSSPITPREPYGRTSTVGTGNNYAAPPTPTDAASEVSSSVRTGSSRRSLGFAGRISSSMGSRLRAARAERKDGTEGRGHRDLTSPIRGDGYVNMMEFNGGHR